MYLRNLILVASMMIGMTVSTKTAAADVEITYTYDGHIYVDGNESDFEFSISWNDIVTKSLTALGGSISKAEFENNWIFDGDNGDESILTQYSDNHTTLSQPIGSVIFYTGDYKVVQWRIDANSLMNVISQGEVDRNTGLFTSPITTYLKLQGIPNVWVKLTIPAGQIHVATDIGIAVNATNFPDEAFRNWVLQNVSGASDGWLTDSEIAEVKEMDCPGGAPDRIGPIVSLQGIEFFTSLTKLSCSYNPLKSLDVSKNTALTRLYCSDNQLKSLDVSNNTALTLLICSDNQLKSLDASKNTALEYFECGHNLLTSLDVSKNTALTILYCNDNQLKSLDVSKNTALTSLSCYSNQLTSLDVSKNTSLKGLNCSSNQFTSLDVGNNTSLTYLGCLNNQLTSLDVGNNTALTYMGCLNNQLTCLDLSKNSSINIAEIGKQSKSLIAVSTSAGIAIPMPSDFDLKKVSNLKLNGASVSGSLATIDGQKYLIFAQTGTAQNSIDGKNLTYDYSTGNNCSDAASMDVTVSLSYDAPKTYTLSIQSGSDGSVSYDGTTITNTTKSFSIAEGASATISISPNSGYKLSKLTVNGTNVTSSVNNNQYTISNITSNTSVVATFEKIVTGIEVNATNFPDTNFRNWVLSNISGASDGMLTDEEIANVTSIDCNSKSIASLKGIEFFSALTYLHCNSNQLTSLDVSKNTELTDLYCSSNQLTSLDVLRSMYLTTLDCSHNQLTSLDVSENTKLTSLSCDNNQLTSLDVSKNTRLIYLDCEGNQLTSLDVSKNTALITFWCHSNKLTSLDVSKNTALTSLSCYFNQLTSLDVSKNTILAELWCYSNQLTSLDVSNNTALTQLFCYSNQLTNLDVSKNTALTKLSCHSNQLTSLDLSKNSSINFASIGSQTTSLKAVSTGAGVAIPMPSDFDFTKVSNLKLDGTSVSGSLTTVNGQKYLVFAQAGTAQSSIDGKKLTYQYNTGNSFSSAASIDVSVSLSYDAPKTYTLSIQSGSGGSISYDGTTVTNTTKSFTVVEGTSATISISPNSDYKLSKLTVNGTNVTSSVKDNQYTISNITANTSVVATFEQITYTLSVQAIGSGTVAYNNTSVKNTTRTFTVNHGTSATLTITPDTGYRLASLTVNGTDVTSNVSNGKYTVSNITANTIVVATFEQIPVTYYTLSIQSGSGGSVSYDGTTVTNTTKSFTVAEGASATISISPNSGYKLSKLTVNGSNVASSVSNNQYTISNITANTTVVATFEQITYNLNVQASGNGSITYNGTSVKNGTQTFTVNHGASATMTLKPDDGCRLASLAVNGTDETEKVSNNQYTISNITATTSVVATFEDIPVTTYTLSIQSGGGGSVSYNGITITNDTKTYTVAEGASATITITPDSGYRLSKVTENGTDVTSKVSDNQYTVSNITANTTVSVTFEDIPPATYTLNISTNGNGSASYSGETIRSGSKSFTLNEGTNATITFSPDNGYRIANVIVNNTDVTNKVANNQYTISGIQENTSVSVTFEEIPPTTYMLSIMASGNGSVAYDGTTVRNQTHSFTINEGSFATLLLSPDDGYHVASIIVNSVDVTSAVEDNQYTVSNIKANTVVSVSFEEIPPTTYTLSITASGNGSIVYDGTTARNQTRTFTLVEGSSAVLTITPDNGHRVASAKVNGSDVTAQITNHQYTINNISANTSVEAAFAEIEYTSIDHEGLNYRVVSNSNKTVSVAKGSYGYYITVPESFTENYFDWTVTGMDDDVLSSNPQLAAVIWNPSTLFTGSVDNPNFLLYVKSSQYAPSSIKNVVVNGTANNITLTDAANGNNFYCPQEFTAKQINYTHYYSMTTGIETAQGWESIALPFDVQSITHPSKGTLVPFANWRSGSSEKPFWLYQLSGNGFVVANSIQANRPYIISLPNNSEYREEYRVNGVITFSATDATVKSSENLQTGSYSDRTFIPNFINQNANNGFYVLNAINNYSTNAGGYAEGSRFVRNLRAVHPFEAYIASANNAKESIPIFDDETTWIKSLSPIPSPEGKGGVFNLSGQQVRLDENHSTKNLKKGVYIVDGKKIVIR